MDLYRMASFPFLSQSIAFMKAHPEDFASIGELAEDMLYEGVREMAMARVHAVLRREEIPRDFHSPEECREEVLSYILSRILIGAVGDPHLIKWYSLAESVRAQKLLSDRTVNEVLELATDIGVDADHVDEGHIELGFIPYITYSSSLKSYDWKLANQPLKDGNVVLSKERFVRILLEALKAKFEKELTVMTVPEHIRELFKPQLEEITGITMEMKEAYDDHVAKVVIPWRFPPCIHNLLGMTRKGENVSHSGRFAMTSFFLHIGMTVDEIIDLFKVSPDFREDLARYQVEHIHGDISGTDYESMACKTMISYGLCIGKDRLCEKIVHPLGYYEARNDDCLPEEQRRIRRALSAISEVARTLKIPGRELQKSIMEWFTEKAVIMTPEVTEGQSPSTHPTTEGTTDRKGTPATGGSDQENDRDLIGEGEQGEKQEKKPERSEGAGQEGMEEFVQEGAEAGEEVRTEGVGQGGTEAGEEVRTEAVEQVSNEVDWWKRDGEDTKKGTPEKKWGGEAGDGQEWTVVNASQGMEGDRQGGTGSETQEGTKEQREERRDTPKPSFTRLQRVPGLSRAEEGVPTLFRLKVIRAWLHGIKVLHPGTMETVYYVGTTGIVDDQTGRAIKLLPVLDFEHGQILRDFQKTGKELEISGQVFTMRGRQFLHVFNIVVPI